MKCSQVAGLLYAVLFVAAGIWVYFGIKGYVITSPVDPAMLPNPLNKTVEMQEGAWFANFAKYPVLWLLPALAVGGGLLSTMFISAKKAGWAIICSSLAMVGTVFTPLAAMFPFLMPSSTNLASSLTAWDCTSSHTTLFVMFVVTLIFLPIVLFYTGWAYKVLSGKITPKVIQDNSKNLY